MTQFSLRGVYIPADAGVMSAFAHVITNGEYIMTKSIVKFDHADVKAKANALYLEALDSKEGFDMTVRKYASKYAGSNQALYEYHMCVALYAISLQNVVALEHTKIFAKRMTGLIAEAMSPMVQPMRKYRGLDAKRYRAFAKGCLHKAVMNQSYMNLASALLVWIDARTLTHEEM